MHELLLPAAFLLGEWEGEGRGLWEGGFEFEDHWAFTADPSGHKPVIDLRQSTVGPGGVPSHGESGYLIAAADGRFHMTMANPGGIAEVLECEIEAGSGGPGSGGAGAQLRCVTTAISRSPTAKDVTSVERRWRLDEDGRLVAETDIALGGAAPGPHTRSVLLRRR